MSLKLSSAPLILSSFCKYTIWEVNFDQCCMRNNCELLIVIDPIDMFALSNLCYVRNMMKFELMNIASGFLVITFRIVTLYCDYIVFRYRNQFSERISIGWLNVNTLYMY